MNLDYMSRLETAEGGVTYHFSGHHPEGAVFLVRSAAEEATA